MYRSRLGGGIGDAALRYVSSVDDDAEIMAYDIIGSQAHVLMLNRCGIIKKSDAKKILAALRGIKSPGRSGAEDVHELVESLVIKKAGMESGGRMHTARSRNDQVALDMRMKVRDDINTVCGRILDVAEALVSVAGGHQKTIMPLYTHMQQAQAGLFSHYLLSHVDALLRDVERLAGTYGRVNQSPLGAGPVGGTGIPINRKMVAQLLGFDGLVENSIDATSARDFAAEYVSMTSIMMTNLSRIAEDLVVWSTAEFGFVELADEFASPSSIMPQKKNPDILELTRGKTARILGDLVAVLAASKGLATGYGRDLQQAKQAVWSASRISAGALEVLRPLLLTIKVDEKRMRAAAESSNLVALDISDRLVGEGIPFRVTHQIAGALARIAHESKRPVSGLGLADAKKAVRGTKVDAQLVLDVSSTATVSSSLKERKSAGSSGYAEQKRMIAGRAKKIHDYRTELASRENRIKAALEDLQRQAGRI